MCGIAGFTHLQRPADPSLIQRITASLIHRGPDQQGVYESPRISLGAVRLKVIDLASGDQPMVSQDGATVIAFNGEIYNHRELRRELDGRGHRFRGHCDTELVLAAFREWDRDCFRRLRGMFAVALWTESASRLVLARDRMGIKPLYFARRGSDLYFGSELKAILEHPAISRVLDLAALEDYLSLNYVPKSRTLVEGVEKLAPGHWLDWRSGEIASAAYWQLVFDPQKSWTLEGAKERLDELLRDSVREHLVADVPLGVWSSGGIDSSTILHYAAEASSAPLKTFSISFPGRAHDESPWFREISRRYGTEHHEFDLNPDSELRHTIEEFAWYSDEPCADAGAVPVWFLSRMCRSQVTVALSGDGADELFGGYLTYLADRWACPLRLIPKLARRGILRALERYLPVTDEKIGFDYKVKRFLEGSLAAADEAHFFWNGAFSPAQKRSLLLAPRHHSLADLVTSLPSAPARIGFLNRYVLADQKYYLPADILHKVDRMSMAHSLEVRPPFLDHRIVEFAASLPQNFKIRGFTLKYLLRELMGGKLPDTVLRRGKMGLDIPTHEWFRGVLRPMIEEMLAPAAVRATGLFHPEAVERMLRDHLERRVNVGYHQWGLLTLLVWMKRWKIAIPPAGASGQTELAPVLATTSLSSPSRL
ncbi:MAG: asparagine synthase (glutamine-hydrolyzing) [Candidatus Solibacter usitatus]|nr:asparagine synthase (glutamine-hydrolyzing) [Candidatus Solibacter usitatus]